MEISLMPARAATATDRGREAALTSLIFPTYNPGPLIERTWEEIRHFLHHDGASWEVLFVCDGCTDGTTERLAELTAGAGSGVRVLSYAPNRGKGHAVRIGLAAARGNWRVFTDVDLAYSFENIIAVADALRAGADVAIGSRAHRESQITAPVRLQGYLYRRHLQSLAFSTVVRRILPLRQRDTQAGLKGLSARAARLVLPRLHCDGFEFDCELLTACARYGLHIEEVPIHVRYDNRHSTTNLRSTLRMLRALWEIRKAWPSLLSLPADWATPLAEKREAA
jgi:dolichyl-phosphate beta-glucosyltransferase